MNIYFRDFLPSILDWDAIWFASRSLEYLDTPDERGANQKYIFWEIESAANLFEFDPQLYDDFFDWTVTYRMDSTVPLPYGWFNKIKNHPEGRKLKSLIKQFGEKNRHLAKKPKASNVLVAWMVSNCYTVGNREQFVEELREFIDVDIYGECGRYVENSLNPCCSFINSFLA